MSQNYYPPPHTQQYYPPPPQEQYYPPVPGAYSPVPVGAVPPPGYEQGAVNSTIAEKWNPRPAYQDLWALVLFLIHFVGYVVLSYVGIKEFANNNKNGESLKLTLDDKAIGLLASASVIGFALSLIYMLLMQRFPKPFIKVTLWLSIASYFVAAAVYGFLKDYLLAVIFAIFGVFYLIVAWTWRERIPFAAIMLETVTSITRKYYGTIVVSFAGLVLQVGWSVWWIFTVVGAFQKFDSEKNCTTDANGNKSCNNTALDLVLLYLIFSFYWTSQVIKTVVHVTDSGVYAAFYFLEGTPQGTGSAPTLNSLKRALTTSLGTICFGSLIIAILNTIKAILRIVSESDGGACGFVACCFAYLLSWIEAIFEYFNHYAYVEVAIYGKPYCQAAKDTWRLIKDRGVEAIINDNLIGNVLTMGALFIGALCGLFGYGYVKLFSPAFNSDGQYTFVLVLICFLLGLMMTVVVTDAIDSGVATIFVALAEDPAALRRTKPELFERVRQRWPRVVQGL